METQIAGNLLIATGSLENTPLARSVCLLLDQQDSEIIGVMLNRPLKSAVHIGTPGQSELIPLTQSLHLGGPNVTPLFALHNCEALADTNAVNGIYMAQDSGRVKRLLGDTSHRCRLMVGYVRWSIQELHSELVEGRWQVMPAAPEYVFASDENMWHSLARKWNSDHIGRMMGAKHIPRHPALN